MEFRNANLQTALACEALERAQQAPEPVFELYLSRASHWRKKLELGFTDTETRLIGSERETVVSESLDNADGRLIVPVEGEVLGLDASLAGRIEKARTIHFAIGNSCGGCARSVLGLLSAAGGKPTTAHCERFAASASALLVALAPGARSMHPDALLMIHQPRLLAFDSSKRLRAAAQELDKLTALFIRRLVARTRQPARTVWSWFAGGDTYFSAERALSCGLIDEVSES